MFSIFRCNCVEDEQDDNYDKSFSSNKIETSIILHNENTDRDQAEVQGMQMKRFNPHIAAPDVAIKKQESTYWNRYLSFVASPKVVFYYESVFYLAFLALFSYVLLCKFNYNSDDADSIEPNMTTSLLFRNSSDDKLAGSIPSFWSPESFLIFWVFWFIVDEIHQFWRVKGKFKSKILKYMDNRWNYLDICGCFLFIIAICLRFIAIFIRNENVFIAARILLAIDLVVWFVRLLHKTIIFRSLGPKLVMISQMVKDLIFFMVIISIFVCTFGIVTQATLHPNNKFNVKLFRDIINKAYWPIYGEMLILEEINDGDTAECKAEGNCPLESGIWFSYAALMVYMVVANVLLINLLIAMFSSTFERVQENTDQIWKLQRYVLVFEYIDASILPPPINFIGYIITFVKYILKKKADKSECERNNF